MSSLAAEINERAVGAGVPFVAHFDITYRCNERCVHCYLDHDDAGEMSFAEIDRLLGEMADAGVFQLTISGGEPLLRKDFFAILRRARELGFNVKLKTNAVLIGAVEAAALRELYLDSVQISVYSHRAEVHDGITKVKGSLDRSLAAARFLVAQGLRVKFAHVMMRLNRGDYPQVQMLAQEIGAGFTLDPTITPHLNGDRSILALNISREDLNAALRDERLVGDVAEFCAPPVPAGSDELNSFPCSAGHSACYISPYGDFYPCVQFPLACGNVRQQPFATIWRDSPQLAEVRSVKVRDLPVCSTCVHAGSCTRCPGLAYMEGNLRGPSSADCEKSFARTGLATAAMLRHQP
ncbi:MAG TPA: radical SAM protein [Candidatus Binataceae bacterium]|nr:radical SAM protein [Candidatus Binataceae bacterium]